MRDLTARMWSDNASTDLVSSATGAIRLPRTKGTTGQLHKVIACGMPGKSRVVVLQRITSAFTPVLGQYIV
jgi:hypothetical protein